MRSSLSGATADLGLLRLDRHRIRRFRHALDELGYDSLQVALRGSYPKVPFPPYGEFTANLRRLEPRIRTWFEILMLGRAVDGETARKHLGGALVDDLLALGLLGATDGRVATPGLALAAYRDRYFVAGVDRTYPAGRRRQPGVYIGASSYRLAAELPYGHRFRAMLDLGTGTGLLAILMTGATERAVAVDVDPDAVRVARFNAVLNGVETVVDVREGDLFDPVVGERFDLVAFNLPFVNAPARIELPPTIRGPGADGLATLVRTLTRLGSQLSPGGLGIGYLEGIGDQEGPFLTQSLRSAAAGSGLKIEITLVQRVSRAGLLEHQRVVGHELRRPAHIAEWRRWLSERGARFLYQMLIRARRGRGALRVVWAIPRR
jgi:SAM-dependent methyltransferase